MACQIKDRTRYVEKYLEGSLSDSEVKRFEEHIFECDLCFQEVLLQQETAKVVRAEGKRLLIAEEKPVSAVQKWIQSMQNLIPSLGNARWNHVFAYASLIIVVLVGSYFALDYFTNDTLNLNFQNHVPYKYQNIQLRGQANHNEIDPILDIFIKNFQAAIGDYNIFEYKSAVKTFSHLKPLAERLLQESDKEERVRWVRNYYFYKGLSHLAIATDKKSDKKLKDEQIQLAIENIQTAIEISEKYHLTDSDRENYFLIMALLAKGDRKQAEDYFSHFSKTSPFRFKAERLLK